MKHFATEFLIIVAGILAALAVDQWRQDREELRILNESLADVAVEIRGNISTVERIQNRALVQKMNGLGTVLRFLSDPQAPVDDLMELLKAFAVSARGATPWLVNDRFEALRNSGNLRLLRDANLVNSLVEAYEGPQVLYSQVERLQGTYPTVVNEIIPATMQVQWNPIRWYVQAVHRPGHSRPRRRGECGRRNSRKARGAAATRPCRGGRCHRQVVRTRARGQGPARDSAIARALGSTDDECPDENSDPLIPHAGQLHCAWNAQVQT